MASKEVVTKIPESSPSRGGHLNNLALALYRQAEATRLIEHLNDSVHEAVKVQPP